MQQEIEINGVLQFRPAFFERVWGGHALREKLSLETPEHLRIGEAWLLSDHPVHESVVMDGPHEGRSIHTLLDFNEAALLGRLPRRTRAGRFPLMLKLLDCTEMLSVQVHPDDALSGELGEEDGGKTEMWYFLDCAPGADIICGLSESATPDGVSSAVANAAVGPWLRSWPVHPGDAALVRAGTVHALGGGLLAAEIQQTSDITYRLHDWNRVDAHGMPRELHVEKAMRCINWTQPFPGLAAPLPRADEHGRRVVLGACEFFAAERVDTDGSAHAWESGGRSFRLLLGIEGEVNISAGADAAVLLPGHSALVAGCEPGYISEGQGAFLDFYVPDLEYDIALPLRRAGHGERAIRALMGYVN